MLEKLPVAFLAGLLSVVTPCVLPLVPGYLSAVWGVEVERLGERGTGRRIVSASLPFIAGFSVVFVVLGACAAAIASVVAKTTQTQIAGFALIVIGLAFVGTVLASILVLASSSGGVVRGVVLLLAYSLGLGAAFVAAGVAFAHAMR